MFIHIHRGLWHHLGASCWNRSPEVILAASLFPISSGLTLSKWLSSSSSLLHPVVAKLYAAGCIKFIAFLPASPWTSFHKAVRIIFLTFKSNSITPLLKILQQCPICLGDKSWLLQVASGFGSSLLVHPPLYPNFYLDSSDSKWFWAQHPC